MSPLHFTTAVVLLLLPASLPAQDAREVLIHSLEQERHVSFAGYQTTIVTDRGKVHRAAQVVKRRAPDKLRIEYLAPARLKGELVIDDGNHLRRLIPTLKVVEEGPSRLQRTLQRQSERIRSVREGKTEVTLVGENSLLGRPVTIIQVTPAKPDRPVRTLWLDRDTGVALRIEEKSPGGRTSVTAFDRISFDPVFGGAEFQLFIPAGFTVVPARLGRPISLQRAQQIAQRFWGGLPMPSQLPPGFNLSSAHQLGFHQNRVIALRYTRGRDDLSLFISGGTGPPFSAPVQPRLNVVQRPIGGMLVTLVGSLPTTQLEQIVASVRLSPEPATAQPPVVVRTRSR